MKRLIYLLTHALLFLLMSCDVHEWPEEDLIFTDASVVLHLDFTTEMPLYTEIDYARNSEVHGAYDSHDIRYIVNVYRTDNKRAESRLPDTTLVVTKSSVFSLNHVIPLTLQDGTYAFRIWTDYVDVGTTTDKYYKTDDFSEIILMDRHNHSGSNDYRDAFKGEMQEVVVSNGNAQDVYVTMTRPLGKFKFVSTDVTGFLNRVAKKNNKYLMTEGTELFSKDYYREFLRSINLNDYEVFIRYDAYMPCSFNMFTNKPADSWTGVSFKSRMYSEGDMEMVMGYDYIFVNGSETTLAVSLEVYDSDGEMMSSTNSIMVPIVRSKLSVVRGEFLTAERAGGVTVNPGYDGDDFNVPI
jgi:hypothetical protein